MTRGAALPLLLRFSVPLLISNLFQQLYNVADTMMVGRLIGVSALAAVGVTGPLVFLVFGFVQGLTSGFSVLLAQAYGGGDTRRYNACWQTLLRLGVVVSVVITLLTQVIAKPLLEWIQTPEDILPLSLVYFRLFFAGLPVGVFSNLISIAFFSVGYSRPSMLITALSCALNLGLDALFIAVFHWGVAGAAIATLIAQVGGFLLLLWIAARQYPFLLRWQRGGFSAPLAKQLMGIGLPMALQSSITAMGAITMQGAVNAFGTVAVAAFTAASRVEQLFMQPYLSFGGAIATYTGQNKGAGRLARVREGRNAALLIVAGVSVLSLLLLTLGSKPIVLLFVQTGEAGVLQYALQYLHSIAFFIFPLGLIILYRGLIQGMGNGWMPMLVGVLECMMRVVLSPLAVRSGTFAAICRINPITWVVSCIPLLVYYRWRIAPLAKNAVAQAPPDTKEEDHD